MTRRTWTAAIVIAVAVAAPVVVIFPVIPPGPVSVYLTPAAADATPLPLVGKSGGRGEVVAPVPRAVAALPKKAFSIRFGTFLRKPSARIVIEFVDADGKRGSTCRLGPADYRDALPVSCGLRRNERPARVRISASGASGELAVFGSATRRGTFVGRWIEPASGRSFGARVAFAERAIDAFRPGLFGFPVLVAALGGASGLAAFLVVSFLATAARDEPPDK